jgi:hypothetical protein
VAEASARDLRRITLADDRVIASAAAASASAATASAADLPAAYPKETSS